MPRNLASITPANDTPRLLPLINPGAWDGETPPEREWALADYIPHRQATYLTGAGSAGKSLVAQQLCTCIALGLPFMGVETRQTIAIYVTCEDDQDELQRRQHAICEALGVSLSSLSGKLHFVTLAGEIGNELATFAPDGAMQVSQSYGTLQSTALQCGAGFLALDNVAHLFSGNENIRNQVAGFVGLMNMLAQAIDGSVLFLGHPNKAGESYSGSTAWENQVRSRLFLETPKDENGNAPDPDARELSRGKSNYARNGDRLAFRWHKWAFVREADLPKDTREELTKVIQQNADADAFMQCLAERNRQSRPVSEHPGPNYAPTQFVKMPEAKGIGKARLVEAMDRLFRMGLVERGFVCRDDNKRRNLEGLIAVKKAPQTPAPNAPQTLAPNAAKPAENMPQTHTHIYKYISGAEPDGSPPPIDEES